MNKNNIYIYIQLISYSNFTIDFYSCFELFIKTLLLYYTNKGKKNKYQKNIFLKNTTITL